MSFFDLLRADGSMVVNKKLARSLGLETAIMYSELLSKYYYFESRGQTQEGWFFNSIEDMEFSTCLTAYLQRKAIENLKKYNFIECELRGMPATRFFKMNFTSEVLETLYYMFDIKIFHEDVKNFTQDVKFLTSDVKNFTQDVKKPHSNNTNKIILNNNTNKIKEDMSPTKQQTLISLPQTEKKASSVKKKMTHSELAQHHVQQARERLLKWEKVTDRDFTLYYQQKHEQIMNQQIKYDMYNSTKEFRDWFISKYDIPREQLADFIDELLLVYKTKDIQC